MSTTAASSERYTGTAIALHWLIATLLGLMIGLGKNMTTADGRPIEWMFQLHKSVGITVLTLMIARLIWRLKNRPPELPDAMHPLEKRASHLVHIGLYALCFLIPLSGWIMVSMSPFSIATVLYGIVPWPHLPGLPELALEVRRNLYPNAEEVHELLSWTLMVLFALHVIGAVKHEIMDDEGVINRMIPALFGKTTSPRPPSRDSLIAFGSAALFFGLVAGSPVLAQGLQPKPQTAAIVAEESNWTVDHDTSEIRFSGVHDGNEFTGIFENWSASINWTEGALTTNTVNVSIETGSALTGNTLYDTTLDASEWFHTSKFPNARVALSGFSLDEGTYTSQAEITLKDATVATPFIFNLEIKGDKATMTGKATLSRVMFNLGQDSDANGDWVSPKIDVRVSLNASRIAP